MWLRQKKPAKDLQRCPLGDNDCIRDTSTMLIKRLAKGEPRINLVSVDPLHVSSMILKQGTNSPVRIELKFIDVDLYGLSDYTFTNVRLVFLLLLRWNAMILKCGD